MNARQRRKTLKASVGSYTDSLRWQREPNGDLVAATGGPDDEGYRVTRYSIARNGRTFETSMDGRDCDGRVSSFYAGRFAGVRRYRLRWVDVPMVGGVRRRDAAGRTVVNWERVPAFGPCFRDMENERRDYAAEAAGY